MRNSNSWLKSWNTLQLLLFLQLNADSRKEFRLYINVHYVNDNPPHRWIGSAGYAKDHANLSPQHTRLAELRERVSVAVIATDGEILLKAWAQLGYRWNVCRVTMRATYNICMAREAIHLGCGMQKQFHRSSPAAHLLVELQKLVLSGLELLAWMSVRSSPGVEAGRPLLADRALQMPEAALFPVSKSLLRSPSLSDQLSSRFINLSISRQSQCSRVLQAPSCTVGFTRRFYTLSSIQATSTSLAVVLQSPVVVHTSIRSCTLARRQLSRRQLQHPARLPPRRSGLSPQPGHSGFSHLGIVPDVGRRDLPFPLLFRCCFLLASITLIGSQDLAVKSCPNLFTHSLTRESWEKHHRNVRVGKLEIPEKKPVDQRHGLERFPCENMGAIPREI
ncbi:hypothetical protein PR048_024595 [Dryococelus australis]|uniref:Uncharacterized protein n=1 Tax=Dryococelus australis TaxID=614101 RepID=A0ABQ9GP01_9NEOP|nr:hypothetical protein PR048_024595 [Dryococelus australis]